MKEIIFNNILFSSFDEFETETLARLNGEDLDPPHSMGMASLPKFASLEAAKTPIVSNKTNPAEETILEEAVQNIDLGSTPSRPVQRRVSLNSKFEFKIDLKLDPVVWVF